MATSVDIVVGNGISVDDDPAEPNQGKFQRIPALINDLVIDYEAQMNANAENSRIAAALSVRIDGLDEMTNENSQQIENLKTVVNEKISHLVEVTNENSQQIENLKTAVDQQGTELKVLADLVKENSKDFKLLVQLLENQKEINEAQEKSSSKLKSFGLGKDLVWIGITSLVMISICLKINRL